MFGYYSVRRPRAGSVKIIQLAWRRCHRGSGEGAPLVGWAHALAGLYWARCKLVHGEKAPTQRYGPANAHAALDRAAFAAYGWPEGIENEAVLKSLLALNLERGARARSRPVRPRIGALDTGGPGP